MLSLADVNILIALILPSHEHHERAWQWFESQGDPEGWATCALTELAAIRICAQLPERHVPRATADAIVLLAATSGSHVFWSDRMPPSMSADVRDARTAKQVSDRYLLGLARHHDARLVTFDRGLAQAGGRDVLCLTT